MTQPQQSQTSSSAHRFIKQAAQQPVKQKSFALRNMRGKGFCTIGRPFKATGHNQPPRIQTRLTDHKYAATPVPQSPRSRSLALLRGPAMRTRSMPLRSMPTPRLTERRTYLRPFSPRAVVDEIMHISTFFTKPVARLWSFHLPSAHGKFWPQHIFRTGAGTRSGGKTAS